MKFEFASPTRVVFGPGTVRQAGSLIRPLGMHALIVTGRQPSRAEPLGTSLRDAGIAFTRFPITGEPTIESVTHGVREAKAARCDVVIGFGGGSALDAAKTIAAMATNAGDLLDYLEVIGQGRPLQHTPLPFIAIPTTAGTGSEVTRNAVIGSPKHKVKVSLRSPLMLARVALVDPELTLGLPPEVTATTGMDALTQCIEAYVSCKANPFTDAFCVEGIQRAVRSLRKAVASGDNLEARTDMSMASLCSGIALANAGLGAVHGFAGPLGGMFEAPHGALCAALLPSVMQANLNALQQRDAQGSALKRFEEIARWLTSNMSATAEDGVQWLQRLTQDLSIPRLGRWGIAPNDFAAIIEKAAVASSMKGNPIQLDDADLRTVLEAVI